MIADAVCYYTCNNTPLTREGVTDIIQGYLNLLSIQTQTEMGFVAFNNRPSQSFLLSFMARNGLCYRAVRQMDDERLDAVTRENIADRLARLQGAILFDNNNDSKFLFNMDQSGSSFAKMIGRLLRRGCLTRKQNLVLYKTLQTKGNLDRVTIFSVVSASGKAYTPVVNFSGRHPHFGRKGGKIQTLNDVMLP